MMFHAIERSVGGSKKSFGRIAILRESSHTGAEGKRGCLRFRGKTLADAADDARGDVTARFGQHDGEFAPAIASCRINRARMASQEFSDAHQCAAARQVSVLVVDGLEAIH